MRDAILVNRVQSEDIGKHPCDVCRGGVGRNSIMCIECLGCVHTGCNGISGRLKGSVDCHCIVESVLIQEGEIELL